MPLEEKSFSALSLITQWKSENIVLSGFDQTVTIGIADKDYSIISFNIYYVEGSTDKTASSGVVIAIGNKTDQMKYAAWESEPLANTGDVFSFLPNTGHEKISKDEAMIARMPHGQTGMGVVYIQVTLMEIT